ncbi:ATPase [Cellulosimicrobium sp. BIT-GX5]|uniref:ATPase n=1 Tax=Cellulosimicrobium composti TaxID=2672572 RepID=A0A6N7ZF15_9MICO|nr:BadF/BadG/BcrA/BcrD ATPase family protein [Cellulosimicrobium composti]MTG87902.1 ATPase [Cellulosimicrobium composti]
MSRSTPDGAWVVGLDVGGSGSRLAARRPGAPSSSVAAPDVTLTGRPVAIGPAGSDAVDVVRDLLARFRAHVPSLDADGVAAAAVGATGLASLVRDPAELHAVLRAALPPSAENGVGAVMGPMTTPTPFSMPRDPMLDVRPGSGPPTAVAADALTAHLGALGGRPGAVVAVGTGAIALGTDLRDVWHRVDGWGHLLGDLGSGSWIGAQGLRAAVAAHDGRDKGGSTALLAAATERFGPVPTWPGRLYTRADRAQVLASFTPDVAAAAHDGDAVARQVLAGAGTHLATTLAAALVDGVPPLAAATGGVLAIGPLLTGAFRARLGVLRPAVELVDAAGTPLDGALHLAARLATEPGAVVGHAPWLTLGTPHAPPTDPPDPTDRAPDPAPADPHPTEED